MCLPASLPASVQSLESTGWKERTDSYKVSSGMHVVHSCPCRQNIRIDTQACNMICTYKANKMLESNRLLFSD